MKRYIIGLALITTFVYCGSTDTKNPRDNKKVLEDRVTKTSTK